MSSALIGVCAFRRLLRREVIGVYWEDCFSVEDMISSFEELDSSSLL